MNIGESIDYLYRVKQIKAKLNKRIKNLNEASAETEQNLIRLIKDQGVCGLHSATASATISEESFGDVEDFQSFEEYLIRTNSLFLLQRRLSQVAYRDLKAAGETIPGTKDFTKTTLSLRKR
jgi:hypothetical protein